MGSMNVLLAAGPESTTLFALTVQGCGGSPGRFVGQRRVTVPLHRLQSTHRQLLLAGDTILSVTRCQPTVDPPPPPRRHPVADGVTPSPSPVPVSQASDRPAEAAAPSPQQVVELVPTPVVDQQVEQRQPQHQTTRDPLGEQVILLLLSLGGVLILLILQVMAPMAQQWGTWIQARQRSDPAPMGVWRREWANGRPGLGPLGQLLRRPSTS